MYSYAVELFGVKAIKSLHFRSRIIIIIISLFDSEEPRHRGKAKGRTLEARPRCRVKWLCLKVKMLLFQSFFIFFYQFERHDITTQRNRIKNSDFRHYFLPPSVRKN